VKIRIIVLSDVCYWDVNHTSQWSEVSSSVTLTCTTEVFDYIYSIHTVNSNSIETDS